MFFLKFIPERKLYLVSGLQRMTNNSISGDCDWSDHADMKGWARVLWVSVVRLPVFIIL